MIVHKCNICSMNNAFAMPTFDSIAVFFSVAVYLSAVHSATVDYRKNYARLDTNKQEELC